jgi:hypothetical protein
VTKDIALLKWKDFSHDELLAVQSCLYDFVVQRPRFACVELLVYLSFVIRLPRFVVGKCLELFSTIWKRGWMYEFTASDKARLLADVRTLIHPCLMNQDIFMFL